MGAPLVVLDLDGTLADTLPDIAEAVNRALEATGRPAVGREAVLAGIGRGVRHLLRACLPADAPEEEVAAAAAAFEAAYAEAPAARTVLYPDAAEALERLGPSAAIALLSNKPTRFCRAILRALRIEGRFVAVIGEDIAPAPKPDPRGLAALRAALAPDGAPAVLVGDSVVDIETARAAGLPCLAVRRGYAAPGALEAARPDRLLDDMRALPEIVAGLAA